MMSHRGGQKTGWFYDQAANRGSSYVMSAGDGCSTSAATSAPGGAGGQGRRKAR